MFHVNGCFGTGIIFGVSVFVVEKPFGKLFAAFAFDRLLSFCPLKRSSDFTMQLQSDSELNARDRFGALGIATRTVLPRKCDGSFGDSEDACMPEDHDAAVLHGC